MIDNNAKISLGVKGNENRFTRALDVCNRAAESNLNPFDEYETNFLGDMNRHWRMEGFKFSPTRKQWNMLMQMKQDVETMK